MKELDQSVALFHSGSVYGLYHRPTVVDQPAAVERAGSNEICTSNENNNNVPLDDKATISKVDENSTTTCPRDWCVNLANGHSSGSETTKEGKRPVSPLLSGCRRRLLLHFNKAIGANRKPRWTSPDMEVERKEKRNFFRRRKSAHNTHQSIDQAVLTDQSNGGTSPPPRFVRSPSAGQIDYSKFATLEEPNRDRDEHGMIAYNSSLLTGGIEAPLGPPYKNNGVGFSSDSGLTENEHVPNASWGPFHESADGKSTDGRSTDGKSIDGKSTDEGKGTEGSIDGKPVGTKSTDQDVHTWSQSVINGDHEISFLPSSTNQQSTNNSAGSSSSSSENERVPTAIESVNTNISSNNVLRQFHKSHNRTCTSFRIKVPQLKNPVDACILSEEHMAIADYDNGFLIVNAFGDVIEHKKSPNELNACGIACSRSLGRIHLLIVRSGLWSVNTYNHNYRLIECVRCPIDVQIETWALRRLIMSRDTRLHLMASGESKSCIWVYEPEKCEWRTVLVEVSGRRNTTYNDMSVRYVGEGRETRILLCEWKKAQLWTLSVNEKGAVIEQKSIKMKRVKGQEWIVQGPHLAILDEQGDMVCYDGSGKLFLFDGETYRLKKIIADVGRGEVSALAVSNGWVYALCRYRLCFQAYLYGEQNETTL